VNPANPEAVIELIRCAVDQMQLGTPLPYHYTPLGDAAIALGLNPGGFSFWLTRSPEELAAEWAIADCNGGYAWGCASDMVGVALEAAARIEESTYGTMMLRTNAAP